MRKAVAALGVVAVLSAGGAAAAYAAGSNGARSMHDRMTSTSTSMDAMHAQMRDAMPADLRAACDTAHAAHHSGS